MSRKKAKRNGSGIQLDSKTIEQIKSLYATGLSKNAIATRLKLSWSTVDKYCSLDDGLEDVREAKRLEFIEKCWENISEAIELGSQKLKVAKQVTEDFDKMIENVTKICKGAGMESKDIASVINSLSNLGNIPLSHISTFIGTLYDKQALAGGDPTEITQEVVSWDDL